MKKILLIPLIPIAIVIMYWMGIIHTTEYEINNLHESYIIGIRDIGHEGDITYRLYDEFSVCNTDSYIVRNGRLSLYVWDPYDGSNWEKHKVTYVEFDCEYRLDSEYHNKTIRIPLSMIEYINVTERRWR